MTEVEGRATGCETVVAFVADGLGGPLPPLPPDVAAEAEHCEPCGRLLAAARETESVFRQARGEPVDEALIQAVLEGVSREASDASLLSAWFSIARPMALAATALVGLFLLLNARLSPPPPPEPIATVMDEDRSLIPTTLALAGSRP